MRKNTKPENNNLDLSQIRRRIKQNSHPGSFGSAYRQASVFMLFCDREELYIPAILKADNKGYPWANQVALPGGHIDKSDRSAADAAYRELEEELGITRPHVDYIGSMGHYETIRHTEIEVFTGVWDEKESIVFDEAEIARVINIPVDLLVETHFKNSYDGRIPGWDELLYPVEDVVVWGVTARIFHYFVELAYNHPN